MVVRNPIIDEATLAVDQHRFPEQRMQEVLDCWLSDRFTGTPMMIDGMELGSTVSRTFTKCNVGWGEFPAPEDSAPFLHLFIVDHRESRRAIKPFTIQTRHTWVVQLMVKVARNQTGTENSPHPEHLARRVASEFTELISGPEKLALVAAGVEKPGIRSPAVAVPTAQWCAESIMIECSIRQDFPRVR